MELSFILKATCLLFFCLNHPSVSSSAQELPSLYEYFTSDGIKSGLSNDWRTFTLNGKPIRIISGAIHYFRVHPSRWRDSLRKLRASGANAVDTYMAWNLHEPHRGVYDFGDKELDMSDFLNVTRFLEIAQEEDLLVILRPGPYICAEWEFGGFPSWLLNDAEMKVRSDYGPYLERIRMYYETFIPQIAPLQFTRGGPIIGVQIENEYGSFAPQSKVYLQFMVDLLEAGGFKDTLLFTSDNAWSGDRGSLPQLLKTVNFQDNVNENLDQLLKFQPDKPIMTMEFWPGWFDFWGESKHNGMTPEVFMERVETILGPYNGSVSFYMFHGGTNFGFMNGAGHLTGPHQAVVTSYDYDAILNEAGDYTEKYYMLMELADKYSFPKLRRPALPDQKAKGFYGSISPSSYLSYDRMMEQVPASAWSESYNATHMEALDINGGSGQSYGYLIHRLKDQPLRNGSHFSAGYVKDFATVVLDGEVQVSTFTDNKTGQAKYWTDGWRDLYLSLKSDASPKNLDLMIENLGRVNVGPVAKDWEQFKGLPWGAVWLENQEKHGFEVIALEFTSAWVKNLTNFSPMVSAISAPAIVKGEFQVDGEPLDTFLDMTDGWHKGIAFVNGFNLGRYFKAGPQVRLYVPAGVLKTGTNTVTVFEQLEVGSTIKLEGWPNLGNTR